MYYSYVINNRTKSPVDSVAVEDSTGDSVSVLLVEILPEAAKYQHIHAYKYVPLQVEQDRVCPELAMSQ